MAISRATPPLLKELNERTVLETIRRSAPISRAEISRRAGISKPTVSLALEALLAAGLVREAATSPAGPTYGAIFFEPVPEAALVLGLDLGARFLRGALCDLKGDVRARQDVEVSSVDAGRLLDAITALRTSLVVGSGLDGSTIDNVVIGIPGTRGARVPPRGRGAARRRGHIGERRQPCRGRRALGRNRTRRRRLRLHLNRDGTRLGRDPPR
jgi:DNA-binding transcriptional ArsR family regulator